jgi:hypothetical protein
MMAQKAYHATAAHSMKSRLRRAVGAAQGAGLRSIPAG